MAGGRILDRPLHTQSWLLAMSPSQSCDMRITRSRSSALRTAASGSPPTMAAIAMAAEASARAVRPKSAKKRWIRLRTGAVISRDTSSVITPRWIPGQPMLAHGPKLTQKFPMLMLSRLLMTPVALMLPHSQESASLPGSRWRLQKTAARRAANAETARSRIHSHMKATWKGMNGG